VCGAVVVVSALRNVLRETLSIVRREKDDPRPEVTRRRDDTFLALWILAFLSAPIIYVHTSAKYLLPAAPAIALLFLRRGVFHATLSGVRRHAIAVLTAVVLAGGLGFCLAHSNASMSNGYRDAARALINLPRPPGRPLWFGGHWGWQYELEKLGAKSLSTETDDLVEGDVIVVAAGAASSNLPSDFWWRAMDISTYSIEIPTVFRLSDDYYWAGFYSNFFGPLPFSLSTGLAEHIIILRAEY